MKLSADPSGPVGHLIPSRTSRAIATAISDYNAAVDAGHYREAANRAGNIAVRLENFDHPDAFTWWERKHECSRRADEAAE